MQRLAYAPTRISRQPLGFTLIELMIAIVVMAVLASIAFPSYLNAVRKSRRAEAISALTWIQQAEERYRANNTLYTTSAAAPPAGIGSAPAGSGYYTYSIYADTTTGTSYVATANANAGTSQAADTNCAGMQLQIIAGTVSYGSCKGGCAAVVADPAANLIDAANCWGR
ncbi:MAG: prepilin-type N-terminal cleavage/methylation domain-containing protein [Burkholderiales bacterium]|nr:prepilin-type N-terminal cleavage/methylation domain-containing protein [Burkholderiales bacterium]